MCSPARCSKCGKTTWTGCGQHVDQVMARVADSDRCTCREVDDHAAGWRGSLFTRPFSR